MTSKDHHKHPKLAKPLLGNFGRNEWAILGSSCAVVQSVAQDVMAHLSPNHRCAYVDATHHSTSNPDTLPAMLQAGAEIAYTTATDHDQWIMKPTVGNHSARILLQDCDVVLVNGNHHPSTAQVLILDSAKLESLKRRVKQLTNVVLLLVKDGSEDVIAFLTDVLPDIQHIPSVLLQDKSAINQFFEQEIKKKEPLLNGLVLAGGHSRRMGRDKGAIPWHGIPQRDHMVQVLRPFCEEVFISCRPEQQQDVGTDNIALPDTFLDLGPFGALLSAFRAQPNRAWLVVACDLPLLGSDTIDFLLHQRRVSSTATTFRSPSDHLPEPLITIWEPHAYPLLLSFLAQGYSCLRKVLIHSDVHIVEPPSPDALLNVNTPDDLDSMRQRPEFG